MRPIVTFSNEANGCGTRNVYFPRMNPDSELLANHHTQEAKQGDDRRCGTLHPNESVKYTDSETNDERQGQYLHFDSPRGRVNQNAKQSQPSPHSPDSPNT